MDVLDRNNLYRSIDIYIYEYSIDTLCKSLNSQGLISRDRLEVVPARSHKPIYVSSTLTPATINVCVERNLEKIQELSA